MKTHASKQMKNYAVSIIKPPDYVHAGAFTELAELVFYGLKNNGYGVQLNYNLIDPQARNIIIGVHLLDPGLASQIPGDSIILNTEQLSAVDSDWNANILKWFSAGFELWDYSSSNIAYLKLAGISNVKKLGIGYASELRRIPMQSAKDVDVLFYGSVTERRQNILDALANNGLTVKHLFGVYGEERDAWIARSKVVLNLHHFDSKIFEVVRVFYLLANSVAVAGEVGPDTHIDEEYRDNIAHAPYDGLVDLVTNLVRDPLLRAHWQEKGFAGISRYPQSQYIKELLGSPATTASAAWQGTHPMPPSDPGELPADLLERAVLQHQNGNLDGALQAYNNILTATPDFAPALTMKGVCLAQMGNTQEALKHLRKAVELQPDYVAGLCNLGNVQMDVCDTSDAIDSFSRALQLSPQTAAIHTNLGLCLLKSGRVEESRTALQKALALDPGNPQIRRNLDLVLAHIHAKLR